MNEQEIFAHIDHTLLKPEATWKEMQTLCREALRFGAASVCVPPSFVARVRQAFPMLTITTVVGFPLGYQASGVKVYEAARAIHDGADEIDLVINQGDVRDMAYHRILAEIKEVRQTIGDRVLKVIIETCLLSEEQEKELCRIVTSGGANYLKTSTGFGSQGANLEDIPLLRENLGEGVAIKAAGGIRTKEEMEAFLEAGCQRLGCSNAASILFGDEVGVYINSDENLPNGGTPSPMEEAVNLMAEELLESIPGLKLPKNQKEEETAQPPEPQELSEDEEPVIHIPLNEPATPAEAVDKETVPDEALHQETDASEAVASDEAAGEEPAVEEAPIEAIEETTIEEVAIVEAAIMEAAIAEAVETDSLPAEDLPEEEQPFASIEEVPFDTALEAELAPTEFSVDEFGQEAAAEEAQEGFTPAPQLSFQEEAEPELDLEQLIISQPQAENLLDEEVPAQEAPATELPEEQPLIPEEEPLISDEPEPTLVAAPQLPDDEYLDRVFSQPPASESREPEPQPEEESIISDLPTDEEPELNMEEMIVAAPTTPTPAPAPAQLEQEPSKNKKLGNFFSRFKI